MHVQVTAQRGADVAAAEIGCVRPQFDKHIGFATGPRLRDDFGGLGADSGQRLPAVRRAVTLPLGIGQPFDDVGGVAVRHHPPRLFTRPVLVVRNLAQGGDRIHGFSVPGQGARHAGSRPVIPTTRSSTGASSATGTAGPNNPSTGPSAALAVTCGNTASAMSSSISYD